MLEDVTLCAWAIRQQWNQLIQVVSVSLPRTGVNGVVLLTCITDSILKFKKSKSASNKWSFFCKRWRSFTWEVPFILVLCQIVPINLTSKSSDVVWTWKKNPCQLWNWNLLSWPLEGAVVCIHQALLLWPFHTCLLNAEKVSYDFTVTMIVIFPWRYYRY